MTRAGVQSVVMNPIKVDPEIMGGRPCFAGTRVPVRNLFDLLIRGHSLDYFLEQFPTVRREQAVQALAMASDAVGAGPISEPARGVKPPKSVPA